MAVNGPRPRLCHAPVGPCVSRFPFGTRRGRETSWTGVELEKWIRVTCLPSRTSSLWPRDAVDKLLRLADKETRQTHPTYPRISLYCRLSYIVFIISFWCQAARFSPYFSTGLGRHKACVVDRRRRHQHPYCRGINTQPAGVPFVD